MHQPQGQEMRNVSEEAVAWAYRLILGRDPENAEVVQDHIQQVHSLSELRQRFLQSSEFIEQFNNAPRERKSGMEPPCQVQVAVTDDTRARLLEHIARSWTRLGETEPYWSVLSEPEYVMERIGESLEGFLQSGKEQIDRLQATLRRCGIDPDPRWEVFELGCGLGRITRWLARDYRRVEAWDISPAHLALARQINSGAPGIEHVVWRQLREIEDIDNVEPFDLFFSVIVLQHNPPPVIALLLEKIAAKLKPNGIAFFQVPTYHRDYFFQSDKYFKLRADTQEIEMHVLPQAYVFDIFARNGCVPLEVFEDEMSGSRATQRSNTFVFRKITAGLVSGVDGARSRATIPADFNNPRTFLSRVRRRLGSLKP